jgi:parallel beta-helix repeat protein
MRHFAGFQRLAATLPLFAALLAACGGGGGSEPPPDTLYVRASGNDNNTGATPDDALRSIARAVQDAVPGQTIVVGPGEYIVPAGLGTGSIDIDDIAGEELLIIADRDGSLTGDRAGEVLIDARNNFGIRVSRSINVTIEGFRFERARGGSGENAAIQVRSSSANVTIRDCVFNLNRDGVRIEGSSHVDVFNNLFYNNNRGIRLNGADDVRILNNTLADNNARGISIGGSARATARNNVLQDNANRNIEIDAESIGSYDGDFNLIFSTQRNTDPEDTVAPSTAIGDNAVLEAALFVNPSRGDYRLRDESPAIDAGGTIDALLLQSLFALSTTADGAPDSPPIDLGFHYPAAEE